MEHGLNAKTLLLISLGAALIGMPLMVIGREHARQEAAYEAIVADLQSHHARPMAAAGIFYPPDPAVLSQMLNQMLTAANEPRLASVRGLVVPHGEYALSGITAAAAYKLLAGEDIRTVILLAPSHYAAFQGAYVSSAEAYTTPLGPIAVSAAARALAGRPPFASTLSCTIQRPAWWQQIAATMPDRGAETPETWEFAIEVQLPFLQKLFPSFAIVPVIYGQVDPLEAAKALEPLVDDKTLVIATTYLSQLRSDAEARLLDRQCLTSICTFNDQRVAAAEADGKGPILTLMHLARAKGWKAQLVTCHNSSQVNNDRERVLGFGSVAFFRPQNQEIRPHTPEEKKAMLQLARRGLEEVVRTGKLPLIDENNITGRLREPLPCYMTLRNKGTLRGTAGGIQAGKLLYQSILENILQAALHDPDTTPVQVAELPDIDIQIDLPTDPVPLYCESDQELLNSLHPGRDGVILRLDSKVAIHLPQVWDSIPGKEAFLAAMSTRVCGSAEGWKTQPVTLYTFRTEVIRESDR